MSRQHSPLCALVLTASASHNIILLSQSPGGAGSGSSALPLVAFQSLKFGLNELCCHKGACQVVMRGV